MAGDGASGAGSDPPPARRQPEPATTALLVTGPVGGAFFVGLIIAAAAVYAAVADADGVAGLDRPVLDWAIAARTPLLEVIVTAFTDLGTTAPMVAVGGALMVVLYLLHRRRTILVLMGVGALGGVTFTVVGKALVGRRRPPLADAVPPFEQSFSFPSGHTLNSTVVAGLLAYLVVWLSPRLWVRVTAVVAAVAWAGSMGLSRVFLGHHWLTDVVFAWLLGLAWLAVLITVHRLFLRRTPSSDPDFTSKGGLG